MQGIINVNDPRLGVRFQFIFLFVIHKKHIRWRGLSYHELQEKASCPERGRTYCLESINQSLNAGKDECPYCDTPIEWFPEIPLPIKKGIRKKKLLSPQSLNYDH